MWYDSFDNDNGEPLQLSQEDSYQMFGILSERLSQDDYDPFEGDNWADMCSTFNNRDAPAEHREPNCHVVQSNGYAPASQMDSPEDWNTGAAVSDQRNVESKSTVLNKIQNLQSTSFTLDEEIEEQRRRNASLVKQIAETREQFSKMKAQDLSLRDEFQAMEAKNREFESNLDKETRQLTDAITKKRREISEIKEDAEMLNTLREERDIVAEELRELREDTEDIDLTLYWQNYTYKMEVQKMVIFPFWKLEEDLERALHGENPTLFDERGPPERDDDEGDGYDYEDHDFYHFEEGNDDGGKEEAVVHNQERLDAADKCIGKNSSQSGHDGLKKTKAKRGTKFGKLLANMSFGKNVRQKKQQKKINKSSRFVRWLSRLSCIPKGDKDH